MQSMSPSAAWLAVAISRPWLLLTYQHMAGGAWLARDCGQQTVVEALDQLPARDEVTMESPLQVTVW